MAITITTNSQTIVISAGTPTTTLSQISTSDLGYNNAQEELTAHEAAIGIIPTTEEQSAWDALKVVQPVEWTSVIDLSSRNTHYPDHQVTTAETITLGTTAIEGGAEVNLVGDGNSSHFPTFTGFTKASASADFNTTLNAVNFTVFYWTGSVAYYSIIS